MKKHSDTARCSLGRNWGGSRPNTGKNLTNLGFQPEPTCIIPVNTCEICHKHLKDRRAYAGHVLLAHGKRVGILAEVDSMLGQVNEKLLEFSKLSRKVEMLEAMFCASNISIDPREMEKECEKRGIRPKEPFTKS